MAGRFTGTQDPVNRPGSDAERRDEGHPPQTGHLINPQDADRHLEGEDDGGSQTGEWLIGARASIQAPRPVSSASGDSLLGLDAVNT